MEIQQIQQFVSSPTHLMAGLGSIIVGCTLLGFLLLGGIFLGLSMGLCVSGVLALVTSPFVYWIGRDTVGLVCLIISGVIALASGLGILALRKRGILPDACL